MNDVHVARDSVLVILILISWTPRYSILGADPLWGVFISCSSFLVFLDIRVLYHYHPSAPKCPHCLLPFPYNSTSRTLVSLSHFLPLVIPQIFFFLFVFVFVFFVFVFLFFFSSPPPYFVLPLLLLLLQIQQKYQYISINLLWVRALLRSLHTCTAVSEPWHSRRRRCKWRCLPW